VAYDTFRRKQDVKAVPIVTARYRHCCVSVIMRPSGYFLSRRLALGAFWGCNSGRQLMAWIL